MFDFTHPWYQPLSHRIGVVLLCAIWFGMELYMAGPIWIALSGGVTAFIFWRLILAFPPKPKG